MNENVDWTRFIEFAGKFMESVDLDAEENLYKKELAFKLSDVREELLAGDPEWHPHFIRALRPTNLVNYRTIGAMDTLDDASLQNLQTLLTRFWLVAPETEKLNALVAGLKELNPRELSDGIATGVGSLLLMAVDPTEFPPYRPETVRHFWNIIGFDYKEAVRTPQGRYDAFLDILDQFRSELAVAGLGDFDRLEAQGIMWTVLNVDPTDEWNPEQLASFRQWRGDKIGAPRLGTESGEVERSFGPAPDVEAAAQLIIDAGILGETSPFWPGGCSWTQENADDLIRRIFENFDGGTDSFMGKIERQLAGAPVGVYVLAAEFMAIHMLPLVNVRGDTKISRVQSLLDWSGANLEIPDALRKGLNAEGAFHGGTGFSVRMWRHFCWLARFVLEVRKRSAETLSADLGDPERFALLTESVPDDPLGIKYSLEYLTWPSYFEPITSRTHRTKILKAFATEIGGITGSTDPEIAFDLHRLRRVHEAEAAGGQVDWYQEPYVSRWMPQAADSSQRAWLVRQSQSGTAMLSTWLDEGFVSVPAQHLGSPEPGSPLQQIEAAVNSGYQHIEYSERRLRAQEFHRFLSQMKQDDLVASLLEDKLYLGVITGPAEYFDEPLSRLRRTVVWLSTPFGKDAVPDPVLTLLAEQGSVVDLTEALSVIADLYASEPSAVDLPDLEAPKPSAAVVPVLKGISEDFAASIHLQQSALEEVVRLLQTRQQIVFYGPPGTGKTYIGKKLGEYLAGEEHADHVKTVQFHPSYAYEDFFEGYRPAKSTDGSVGFSLEPGPLRRIAAEAAADGNRDKPYFLIIDEMNRGNLAKIFGELYFLLEYRKERINLQYSPDKTFALPPNLFIIGTMNTSDRSIAMVDAAIRRRFAFVELHPQEGMIAGLLERFLKARGKPSLRADLLNALNNEIEDTNRDLMIGPSYFMKPHAETDEGLEEIWKYELLPLLEEQYFGRLKRNQVREKFGLAAMRRKAASSVGPVDLSLESVEQVLDGEGTEELEELLTDSEDTAS
ncbi:AAA family ATPase [Arthrobacter sp. UYEF3]|uniref:AAA family ATPase n=1 Tax=Arthrobacter sp. UYEF3 TaxID=1756365 RepID=UPI00339844A3